MKWTHRQAAAHASVLVVLVILGTSCCVSVEAVGAYRGAYAGARRSLEPGYAGSSYVDEDVEFMALLEEREDMFADPNLAPPTPGSQPQNATDPEYQGEYGGQVNGSSGSNSTEYQGEYQGGEPTPPPPSNNGTDSASGGEDDSIELPKNPDRLFSVDDCKTCGHFVGTLAEDAIQDKLTRYEVVLQAQTKCQQNADTREHLQLGCNIFDEVEAWLVRAKVIQKVDTEVQEYNRNLAADLPLLSAAMESPISTCELVGVCGNQTQTVVNKNGTQEVADDEKENEGPKAPTTYIVRFKLTIGIQNIPRSSDKFRKFVVTFLQDIANVLSIPAARLQLHAHVGDDFVEVIIRPLGANDAVNPDGSEHNAHHPSKELGILFKKLVEAKDPSLETPNKLLATIDTETEVEVMPLLIAGYQPE